VTVPAATPQPTPHYSAPRRLVGKWQLLFMLVVPMLLFRVVVLNLTEEIGWIGFLQDRPQEQHGPLKASVLVTIPFALWHLFAAYFVSPQKDGPFELLGIHYTKVDFRRRDDGKHTEALFSSSRTPLC
jgi:membrane protease YdiL (CAAX protease family)